MSPYSPVSPGSSPGYSHGQIIHSPWGNERQSPQGNSPHGISPQGVSPNRPTNMYAPRACGNPPRTLSLDSQHYSGYVQDASMGIGSSSVHSPPNVSSHSAKTSLPHYAAPLQRNSRNAMDTYSMNYRYCMRLWHLCDVEILHLLKTFCARLYIDFNFSMASFMFLYCVASLFHVFLFFAFCDETPIMHFWMLVVHTLLSFCLKSVYYHFVFSVTNDEPVTRTFEKV